MYTNPETKESDLHFMNSGVDKLLRIFKSSSILYRLPINKLYRIVQRMMRAM